MGSPPTLTEGSDPLMSAPYQKGTKNQGPSLFKMVFLNGKNSKSYYLRMRRKS